MKTHYRVLSVIVTVVMLIGLMPGFAIASDSQINTETVSYRTPAIFADAGDTIFLSEYNVMFSETTTVAAKDITWISGTATVTNGTVYVANKGVYTLTATSGDLTKTIYIIAKEKSETEYVLYEMDYSDLSSVDDLKNAGFVIAEQPTGFTIGIENEALAIKGNTTKDKNVNARIILPEWLGDFGDVDFSSDIKITKASNTNRYFSLMYRVQNDNFYYPLYCATFRAKTTGHNINYAPGLNSGKTPDWKTGVAISDTANLFDSKSHNFTVSLNGKNVKASVDGTTVIDNNYIGAEGGNFATGYLGYFVRGIDIEIYSTKVTVKKPTQYEKLIPAINPAILANTGDTIDLTKYGVTADDGTILFENAVWTSDDIT
ncbi:MAG: hypothetical protein IKY12_03580, partial [Clostridia bacterium]|nr:hypothetical protein [Clostridia bacterium]